MTREVSSRRTPGGSSTVSVAVPKSDSGMKDTGTNTASPMIEATKNAKPAPTVFQRCSAHQRRVRWYQAITGPSVCSAILSVLSV